MRATPSLVAAGASAVAVAAACSGCFVARAWNGIFGGGHSDAPVPSLASSPAAAAEFAPIHDEWLTSDRALVGAMRTQVEAFLVHWPSDGLAPLAHVYLALLALAQGDFPTADREMTLGATLPKGSARDLWTVACARRERLRGDPDAAIALLRPLLGKVVDPVGRSVYQEELARAALDIHRDYEAISYMDAWLRASTDEELPRVVSSVTALVAKLPKDVLVGALEAMRTARANFGYGVQIQKILSDRLVEIARTSDDAQLARVLLDSDAGVVMVSGEAGAALGELATSKRGLNEVDGRTLGVLLPTESPALRDESADVLRGVMWALGLPRGVRGPMTSAPAPAVAPSKTSAPPRRAPCAPAEAAPSLDEPSPADGIRMVTRDDAGSADRTEVALDELAGEGAAIVLAGLDPQTSTRALRWGEAHGVPVVALVPPDVAPSGSRFSFVLGVARADVVGVLARAAPGLTAGPVASVVDESEVGAYAAQGPRVGPLSLLPPVSCDIAPTRAGDPRFPLSQWDRDGAHGWIVSGSTDCAVDLVGELSGSHARGVVGLTLEAAALPPHASSLRVVTASAGIVPGATMGDARDDEVRRFTASLGTVGWWTALGRDAATLARAALRDLPTDTVTEAGAVGTRRAGARDRLAAVHAPLWTAESTGWNDARGVKRTVCAVEVPPK